MTEDAAGRWPALLSLDNPDATAAAPRVSQAALLLEVVVACAACGVRQTFRGKVPEIGDAAEVWQRGHQCPARLGEGGYAALTNGHHVRRPGLG
jgi:hypothetical protein